MANYLKKEDILTLFKGLANSQGYYGRLIENINDNPEWGDSLLTTIEEKHFTNVIDVILFMES